MFTGMRTVLQRKGEIYGVWRGLDELPHGWVRRLDVFELIVDLVGRLP